MTESTLEKYIFAHNFVQKRTVECLRSTRYLLHDIPFAVFKDAHSEKMFHIRLTRQKRREVLARYGNAFVPSDFYDSRYWVMLSLSAIVDGQVIFDAVTDAYKKVLRTLPRFTYICDTGNNAIKYTLDCNKIIEEIHKPLPIEYGKHIIDFDEES